MKKPTIEIVIRIETIPVFRWSGRTTLARARAMAQQRKKPVRKLVKPKGRRS